MRFASYEIEGSESFGLVTDDGIIDIGTSSSPRTLRAAITQGHLTDLTTRVVKGSATFKLEDTRFLPVIPAPEKILCAGINYRSHADETGRPVPEKPSIFARFADTLVGHNGAILLPRNSAKLDFEGELAAVIGKPGRHIPPGDALDYVVGYTCFNDGSLRDFQRYSVTAGKNFPRTGGLGPWLVTKDEIPDPAALTLVTRLNGAEVQRTATNEMIFSVPELISYVSNFTSLAPGDVIATGTPDGVGHGRNPQLWMRAGDVVEVEISGIGVLRNVIKSEQ